MGGPEILSEVPVCEVELEPFEADIASAFDRPLHVGLDAMDIRDTHLLRNLIEVGSEWNR
jgi:hypothetical protein